MTCLILLKRWHLSIWLVLWIFLFIVYLFGMNKEADDNSERTHRDFKGAEQLYGPDRVKIILPASADERSFEKWMEYESKFFEDNNLPRNGAKDNEKFIEAASFTSLNDAKVTTLNNVCIRHNKVDVSNILTKKCYSKTFSLFIYSSGLNVERNLFGFNVSYKIIPTPNGYKFLNQTVFFHGFDRFFWPDNFYHFTKQFYFPLHYLINETNSLQTEIPNTVFFSKPYSPCINAPFTKYFFPYLNIENGTSYAYYPGFHSGGVCYKNAVFSNELHLAYAENAIRYVREKLGAKSEHCTEKNKIILLRRRKNRRIVNALNLRDIAVKNGYTNFSVTYMEDLNMTEQMQTMLCADVMIGVQGAGLQWAYFMRPLSVVIEIAWPNFGWNFFYSKLYTKEGVIKKINFMALETNNIANKTECIQKHLVHKPKIKLTKEQKGMSSEELFKSLKPTYPGKMCNVYIDEKLFLETLKRAVSVVGQDKN